MCIYGYMMVCMDRISYVLHVWILIVCIVSGAYSTKQFQACLHGESCDMDSYCDASSGYCQPCASLCTSEQHMQLCKQYCPDHSVHHVIYPASSNQPAIEESEPPITLLILGALGFIILSVFVVGFVIYKRLGQRQKKEKRSPGEDKPMMPADSIYKHQGQGQLFPPPSYAPSAPAACHGPAPSINQEHSKGYNINIMVQSTGKHHGLPETNEK